MAQLTAEQLASILANIKGDSQTELIPIDPSSISLTGINGVGGGGDLTEDRFFYLQIQGLNPPDVFDPSQSFIAIYDQQDGTHRKVPASSVASAGADKHYTHVQSVPASTWSITHNLSKYPSIITIDSADSQMLGLVVYTSLNTAEVHFSSVVSGKAFCN